MKSVPLNRQTQEQPAACFWMQAEVVRRKHCALDYKCSACRFDYVMRRLAKENQELRLAGKTVRSKKGQIIFWQDRLRQLSSSKRPCLHSMKGHIAFRACTNDYNCSNCEFDQFFQDQFTVHAVVKPVDALNIQGIQFPQGYYLHPGHSWLKIEEDAAVRLGMDEFSMRLLGPPDRIETPLVGKVVKRNCKAITLYRQGKTAHVRSPVNGVVTAINSDLRTKGELTHCHPYDQGWLMRVKADSLRQDIKHLTMGSESVAFIEKEINHLYQLIEETDGPLSVDGGNLGDDLYGNMPSLGWKRLTQTFLRT